MGICSVDGCDKPVLALGLCAMHRARMQRNGTTEKPERLRPNPRRCSMDGCDHPVVALGHCSKHYQQMKLTTLTCSIDGCDKPVLAVSICSMHYHRLKRTGTIERPQIDDQPAPSASQDRDAENPSSARSMNIDDVNKLRLDQQDRCFWCGASLAQGYSTERIKSTVLVCAACYAEHHPLQEQTRRRRSKATE